MFSADISKAKSSGRFGSHSVLGRRKSSILQALLDFRALMRSRKAMRDLDDHLLRDIGLTRADVDKELQRPLWDAPSAWRR